MQKLSFHPHSDLFPLMDGPEFDALVVDIKTNGLQEPIITLGDQILDGRNRYRACREAGVPFRFESYGGSDPLALVITANIHRRHLTASQRAMIAARIGNLARGSNQYVKRRKVEGKNPHARPWLHRALRTAHVPSLSMRRR
jgi:hypothetical protein